MFDYIFKDKHSIGHSYITTYYNVYTLTYNAFPL